MKTKLHTIQRFSILLSIFCSLFSVLCFSQNYEWQWAKNGGGSLQLQSESNGQVGVSYNFEHIRDIVTDQDNNYYFLGKIGHGNSHVDGNEVTTFGSATTGSHNIIITSFTCDGMYRWSRIIGGGGVTSSRSAYKLALDNNGGVFISVSLFANTTGTDGQPPICFGENNCLPYLTGDNYTIQEGRKSGFLLKYDTDNGDLIWRKDYQGDVNYYSSGSSVFDLQIDSDNVLHTIIGLGEGIHLDGAVTVELEEDESLKYYLVKFNNTTGNHIGTPLLLPLEGMPITDNTSFRYNENLNRYYLTGWKFSGNTTVSFNGVTFGETSPSIDGFAYLLSFNPNDLQDWWYREFIGNYGEIRGIAIDSNSDIYIGGRAGISNNNPLFFGEYPFTATLTGGLPFILKMNSQGEVQWHKTPTGYLNQESQTGSAYRCYDIAINGNEVALADQANSTIWDDFSINRPSGHDNDPTLIRFNKQTGEVIGLHDIYGSGGRHYLTAVTADQDGNYVVGGAMRYSMFTDNPNGIPTLYNIASSGAYTDFFMARLAATPCGTNVASNTNFEKQTLRLYPNPTNGLVHIDMQDLQSYEVYNLLGQRLLSGTNEVINLQDLSSGTYIVKVRTQSGEVMTSKVIKQ